MANYTKTTDFAAKDTLPGGDTNKVVRGTEFETEFDAISTAIATKSDTASPTFTGTVTIPTVDINAGAIDGTTIGANSAAAGTFTNLTASGTLNLSGLSVTFSQLDAGAVTLSSETFSDVDNQIPTNAAVIDYVAATIPAISEVNDLSAVVTWANVPDANITQSSVTQHQAALSIAATQLTGNITVPGNVRLAPSGTNYTELYGNTNAGAIRFNCESNTHGVTLKGPPHSAGATYTLELPNADGSAGQLLKTDGSGKLSFTTVNAAPTITATADGAIANGDPCIITSAGKAKKVTGSTYLKGADFTYTSSDPGLNIGIAYNPDLDHFLAFSKVGSTNRAYSLIVDPSANTVSNGAAASIDSSGTQTSQCVIYDTTEDVFVIAYADGSNYGKASVVYRNSGTTYAAGALTTYHSSATGDNRLVYDSNAQRTVVFYKTATGNGNLNGCVLQASNSDMSITAGTAVAADSSGSVGTLHGATFDSSNNKVVAIYEKSFRLYSVVGTVNNSDNSISFATPVELPAINSEGNYDPYSATIGYDVSASRLVALTAEASNANEFQGTFLTSGSISGTTVTWRPWTSWLTGADASGNYYTIVEPTFVYNSTTNTNVLIGERTTGSQITMQEFKLDSNGDPYFTLGPKVIVEGSNQDRQRMAYSTTDELMVLGRANGSNTTYCVVKDRSGALTEGEFAGISNAAYSDGATATLQITGSVDDSQTGLEVGRLHVLQGDGTIVPKHNSGDYVTAASNKEPNVDIGIAKSATEILIK